VRCYCVLGRGVQGSAAFCRKRGRRRTFLLGMAGFLVSIAPGFRRRVPVCRDATSGSSESPSVASVEDSSGQSSVLGGVRAKFGVCTGVSCTQDGSKALLDMFKVLEADAPGELSTDACGCLGMCGEGPTVIDLSSRNFHKRLRTPEQALALLGGISISPDLSEAFILKHRGNLEMSESRTQDAIRSYSEALRLLGNRQEEAFDQVRAAPHDLIPSSDVSAG